MSTCGCHRYIEGEPSTDMCRWAGLLQCPAGPRRKHFMGVMNATGLALLRRSPQIRWQLWEAKICWWLGVAQGIRVLDLPREEAEPWSEAGV